MQRPSGTHAPRTRGGFTLIELLAVILIVGVLAGVLISQLAGAEESANMSHTRVTMTQLQGIIESWERDPDLGGDYPPSSFTAAQGVDNGGTTLRDYVNADGDTGDNQFHLACYGRHGEPCVVCGTELRKLVLDARTTTFCPVCQKR